jgi:GDSL-like Lipase/Acylhydrolase family
VQNIPVDSELVTFAGALDLDATGTGFVPRRLPAWTRPQIPDVAMDAVVQMPSGVRLVVTTTSRTLEIDVQVTLVRQLPRPLKPASFDLVVDGRVVTRAETTVGHVINLGPGPEDLSFDVGGPTTVAFFDLPAGTKTVEVWLPTAAAVEFRALRIDDDAAVTPTAPPTERRWAHYGSSISHCLSAATPTVTWPALVARSVGLQLTNLGFAGQCMLDPFVARTIRDAEVDVVSMKVAANIIAEDSMRERPFGPALHGFLDTIRETRPDIPILVVSPIFSPFGEDHPGPLVLDADGQTVGVEGPAALRRTSLTMRTMRATIEAVVEGRRALGDEHLHYLSGLELFGADDAGDLPDGLHPNDAGNARIAERFTSLAFGPDGPLASRD